MPFFVNPLKKHDALEYPGVLIPLAEEQNSQSPAADDKKSDESLAERGSIQTSQAGTSLTLEALKAEVESDVAASGHDTAYDRKSKVINRAIQDIGMGRYQWELFVLCGFGWTADNLWLQGVALTLPPLSAEFGISESHVRFTTCALFIGLCIGAVVWGTASDIIGRRLAFNMTLLLCGVFGLAAGGGPTWVGLVAWGFIPNYSCPSGVPCRREDNMGWRYLTITLGAITFVMFICRFFLFHLYESPKFLLSRGRQNEAVATVHAIAYKNRAKTWLTVDILNEIGGFPEEETNSQKLSPMEMVRRKLASFSADRIAPLFATKRLGITTLLLWFCWATIGMAYPLFNAFLPQYLGNQASTPVSIVYRNYAITSIVGVPGSILACYTVDIPYIGRKGTMAVSTCITGVILFCFTISKNPNAQLTCTCLEAFFQNIMYGVLYAYTPEVFPAPNRGTGTGIASCLNRICGLLAPIVAIYAGDRDPNAPIYASGGLFLAAFVAMCLFPIETRGKQSL
ncbi:major facilitator superfamily protein [Coccidioides posadasii C735 delta SOWgp]|uniref:Major facilitator superfamily protein n=1 Tax=Coccidioides posadasii (strain C735) TaxID=222929 RepID=C5P1N0_COCP7|nr:major facilitator superfamily protein [Coccidioides posadasii C735 delta SOWgp]EER29588.1 major facilitator superfamily protein [Coccidioides posadasii C735 delta SOWgp]|eukprot:XP_003071733.1 major facilitator superfamily protein [Coccidioides posadasii C735 delta SOWgp]